MLKACNREISRERALEIPLISKAIKLVPTLVKRKIFRGLDTKSFLDKREIKEIISTLYRAEIEARIDTSEIKLDQFDEAYVDIIYVDSRPTCMLDELRDAWFDYQKFVATLAVRAATSEVAIGEISAELEQGEWNEAVGTYKTGIKDGVLMLNSEGADLRFVSRDFSSSKELVDIFVQQFLFLSGLPEEILFGKSFSHSVISNNNPSEVYSVDLSMQMLVMKWDEMLEMDLEAIFNLGEI